MPPYRLEQPSRAVFRGLPVDPIYTLGMDVPPSWLVRPREAMYDLDNIQLGALSVEDRTRGMEAVFDLDFLVIEGHARNPQSNAPPRGVQLQLTNGNATSVDDTQIVVTLGYLQFKASPGVFQLEIREGRGRDIFKLESVGNEGWESLTVEDAGNEITLTSFEGLTLYPRLTIQPGMEAEDVLIENDAAVKEPPSLIKGVISR
jgi:UDP-glucose:glycoprotein glucosyltransferase